MIKLIEIHSEYKTNIMRIFNSYVASYYKHKPKDHFISHMIVEKLSDENQIYGSNPDILEEYIVSSLYKEINKINEDTISIALEYNKLNRNLSELKDDNNRVGEYLDFNAHPFIKSENKITMVDKLTYTDIIIILISSYASKLIMYSYDDTTCDNLTHTVIKPFIDYFDLDDRNLIKSNFLYMLPRVEMRGGLTND